MLPSERVPSAVVLTSSVTPLVTSWAKMRDLLSVAGVTKFVDCDEKTTVEPSPDNEPDPTLPSPGEPSGALLTMVCVPVSRSTSTMSVRSLSSSGETRRNVT